MIRLQQWIIFADSLVFRQILAEIIYDK